MAGKLFKMIVKHQRTGKAYMRYFKTRKGFNAAKKAGAPAAGGGMLAKSKAAVEKRVFQLERKIQGGGLSIDAVGKLRVERDALKKGLSGQKMAQLNQRVKTLGKMELEQSSVKRSLRKAASDVRVLSTLKNPTSHQRSLLREAKTDVSKLTPYTKRLAGRIKELSK